MNNNKSTNSNDDLISICNSDNHRRHHYNSRHEKHDLVRQQQQQQQQQHDSNNSNDDLDNENTNDNTNIEATIGNNIKSSSSPLVQPQSISLLPSSHHHHHHHHHQHTSSNNVCQNNNNNSNNHRDMSPSPSSNHLLTTPKIDNNDYSDSEQQATTQNQYRTSILTHQAHHGGHHQQQFPLQIPSYLAPSSHVDLDSFIHLDKEAETLVPREIIKRCIRKAKHRGNFAANLAAELFTKDERITCNCTGTRGKKQLSPRRLQLVKDITFQMYSCDPSQDVEETWRKECITAIDAKNRSIGRDTTTNSIKLLSTTNNNGSGNILNSMNSNDVSDS